MIRRIPFLILWALACVCAPAAADVVESTPGGFVVRNAATIAVPPAKVYDAFVKDIASWWDSRHTFSGDAKNLTIDARPGGCWCERLGHGVVQHVAAVFVEPGRKLRFAGALGPLQEFAVSGSLTWEFGDREGSTETTVTYVVGGYRQGGLDPLAKPVDSVLAQQLQRLKNYVEQGTPTP